MENLHAVSHFNTKHLGLLSTPKTLEPQWRNRLTERTANSKWATLTKSRIVPYQILWKHNVLHEINQAAYSQIITKYLPILILKSSNGYRFFKPPDNTSQICVRWFEKSGFNWISITEFLQFVIINNQCDCICDLLINDRVMFIFSFFQPWCPCIYQPFRLIWSVFVVSNVRSRTPFLCAFNNSELL